MVSGSGAWPAWALAALNVYAAILIVLRGKAFGVRVYRPMLVNLALSLVPLVLVNLFWIGVALLVPYAAGQGWGPLVTVVFIGASLVVWTAFFPNASYLITELNFSHRRPGDPVPLWYDIVQTQTLAMAGIANALVSLVAVQVSFVLLAYPNVASATEPTGSWVLAGVLLALGTVGVYIGRFVRANSWDLVNPVRLAKILAAHLRQPGQAATAAGYVATYTTFLAILYVPTYTLLAQAAIE